MQSDSKSEQLHAKLSLPLLRIPEEPNAKTKPLCDSVGKPRTPTQRHLWLL